MSNLTVGQIILDAQRMASRVKDLDSLGSTLLMEAEGNNRLVESLRQYQDDMESLNRITNNKSNAEMVNRIQQQNANSSEILKENRELKVCIEDYEKAMEIIMQKYREHTNSKVLESSINLRDVYNEKLWKIIREQRDKINEMASVMQRAISIDDDAINADIEVMANLRLENKTLRELLQISKQFGSAGRPIRFNDLLLEEKAVQTEMTDDSVEELSLSGASVENANNNSVLYMSGSLASTPAAHNPNASVIHNSADLTTGGGNNNNGPAANSLPAQKIDESATNTMKASKGSKVGGIVGDGAAKDAVKGTT